MTFKSSSALPNVISLCVVRAAVPAMGTRAAGASAPLAVPATAEPITAPTVLPGALPEPISKPNLPRAFKTPSPVVCVAAALRASFSASDQPSVFLGLSLNFSKSRFNLLASFPALFINEAIFSNLFDFAQTLLAFTNESTASVVPLINLSGVRLSMKSSITSIALPAASASCALLGFIISFEILPRICLCRSNVIRPVLPDKTSSSKSLIARRVLE